MEDKIMMEYTNKYWKMIIPIVKKGLVRRFGKEETASLLQKSDAIYRDMLNRADDIGKDNPMSSNMYEGLIFFAIWEAADGKISIDDLREITHEVMGFPLMKAVGIFVNANKSGLARLEKKMHKNAEWLEVHPQYKGVSWDFNFDKTKHSEGFYYHFTRCPLNDFARREGYLEVLPVMCEIDLISASLMHAKLIRRQTLASGGEMCDYWFVGDKSPSAK